MRRLLACLVVLSVLLSSNLAGAMTVTTGIIEREYLFISPFFGRLTDTRVSTEMQHLMQCHSSGWRR